jgi:hypothetical protein
VGLSAAFKRDNLRADSGALVIQEVVARDGIEPFSRTDSKQLTENKERSKRSPLPIRAFEGRYKYSPTFAGPYSYA